MDAGASDWIGRSGLEAWGEDTVKRFVYEAASWLDYRYGERPRADVLAEAIRLAEGRNPRTLALGRRLAEENANPRDIVAKALQLFAASYTYTLEPPPLEGQNPYDDFLFTTRQGFCEHFAGSFTLIMRAAGIPAHVASACNGNAGTGGQDRHRVSAAYTDGSPGRRPSWPAR